MLPWHAYLLGLIFILGGANHFRTPHIYKKIIPSYLPSPDLLVIISGILEMIAGLLLLNPETTTIGAWFIIILLILFIPVHVYMLYEEKAYLKLPLWARIVRVPVQFLLIYWAYQYL